MHGVYWPVVKIVTLPYIARAQARGVFPQQKRIGSVLKTIYVVPLSISLLYCAYMYTLLGGCEEWRADVARKYYTNRE
jgi:hypothetical protein